jgi:hypothetical protein
MPKRKKKQPLVTEDNLDTEDITNMIPKSNSKIDDIRNNRVDEIILKPENASLEVSNGMIKDAEERKEKKRKQKKKKNPDATNNTDGINQSTDNTNDQSINVNSSVNNNTNVSMHNNVNTSANKTLDVSVNDPSNETEQSGKDKKVKKQ